MGRKLLLLSFVALIYCGYAAAQCPSTVTITVPNPPGNNVCENTVVDFTSSYTGTTGALTYDWLVNGSPAASSVNFSTSSLQDGDEVELIIHSTDSNGNACSTSSNKIIMTVNPNRVADVSIQASNTNICPTENVTFSIASSANLGGTPIYSWKRIRGGTTTEIGTSNSVSVSDLQTGDEIYLSVESSIPCTSPIPKDSQTIPITVRAAIPSQPGTMTGDDNICPGVVKTYSVPMVAGATYNWSLPPGWSGSSSSNSINVTPGTSGGEITVTAENSCGISDPRTRTITVQPGIPPTPGAFTTGPAQVCPNTSVTYTAGTSTGATSYTWTLPSGWTGSSTTNSITLTTGASGSGNISVVANNNCGVSSSRTMAVSVNPGTPVTPGVISGDAGICPGVSKTYTVPAVTGATEYIWTLPSGFTAPNLTTSGPSLTVTAGASGSGNITVRASNNCGTSDASSKAISINAAAPVITAGITGPANVCANAQSQGGTPYTYSISVTNNPTIAWTLPSGWSILSGAGTNTISVQTGASGGTVSVTASNSCGSVTRNLSVGLNNPAPVMPANVNISGPAKVCAGATGLQFSIPAITNATQYNWSIPSGWTITAGANTNTVTVTASSSAAQNNTISVTASNSCGTSGVKSYSVAAASTIPGQPGPISTDLPSSQVCPPVTGFKFWVTNVSGNTYNWILPTGFTITNGAGTNEITVDINANTPYGNNIKVEVEAVNACGPSTRRTFNNLNIGDYAYADLGADITVCQTNPMATLTFSGTVGFGDKQSKIAIQSLTASSNRPVTLNINPPGQKVNNFTYSYTPNQADYNNGQVTFKVTTETPTGNNNCSNQGIDEMTVFFRPIPTVTITSTSPICSGDSATLTFTGTPNTTVIYRVAGVDQPPINIGSSGTATQQINNLTATTTYNLRSIQYTSNPNCLMSPLSGSTTVTVTQRPTAAISYNSPICKTNPNIQSVNLTGTHAYTGGTFTAPAGLAINATTGAIDPASSTAGNYTVTYTIPASGNCPAIPVTTEVSILAPPTITSNPSSARACVGDGVSFQVQASGNSLTYQWYRNSVASGNEIAGANSATLNLNNLAFSQAGNYYVVVGNAAGCANLTSQAATLTIDQPIVIDNQPQSIVVCEGDNTSLNITASSGGQPLDNNSYSYQWYKGTPGSGTLLTGFNSPSIPFSNVQNSASGDYYVEIKGPNGYICQVVTSQVATLTVRKTPVVEVTGSNTICEGNSSDISFFNGTPNTTVTYTINGDNTNPQTLTLDANGLATLNTGLLYATNGTDTDFFYQLKSVAYADDPNCNNIISDSVTITVAPNPVVSLALPNDQTEFCSKDQAPVTPQLSGTGTYDGGVFTSNGLSIDALDGSFIPADNSPGAYTITYTVPSYGGCPEETVSIDITIYEEVKITSEPFNLGICSTKDAEFTVVASGDNLTYQWYRVVGNPDFENGQPETDDMAIAGATSPTLSLPVATSEDAGDYYVRISGTTACTPTAETKVYSDVVSLNVDEQIVILEPATDIQVCETGDETVVFKFVAHAYGKPLTFTWIYGNGDEVPMGGDFVPQVTDRDDYDGHNYTVYEGTLTINNISQEDDAAYAVRIDGSANNFNCPIAVSNSFNLDVDPLPSEPITSDVTYCQGDTAEALAATGSNLTWYDSDRNVITDLPIFPDTSMEGTTVYYVTQKDSFCESREAEIVVTINPKPMAPGLTDDQKYIELCLGSDATPLTATPDNGTNLNWYGPNDPDASLTNAPTPPTNASGTLTYWVSQTDGNTCESEKSEIIVKVMELPIINIENSGSETICAGEEITLTASDANDSNPSTTTYSWSWDNGGPVEGATQPFSPTETTTYTVIATNEAGCTNQEQITINVDEAPIGGNLTGPSSVCIDNPNGSIDLEAYSGIIDRWEMKPASSANWQVINGQDPDANYDFSGLTETTSFRAVVTNGVCQEEFSSEITITIDPLPVAGQLLFNGDDRVFMMCEFPTAEYLVPLQISGTYVGEIVGWQFRRNSQTSWSYIKNSDNSNFTGNMLTGAQVNDASNNESTLFRVEVQSGACAPNVYSDFATLSVIPSDIAPSPVTFSPGTLCFGEFVTLSSATGYGGYGTFEGGAFDNSSIANHGWRVMRFDDQTEYTFESAADNIRPERWLRTNPHDYLMANPNGNGQNIYQRFDSCSCESGNKGFAIVSGDNPSTLETPVFDLYTMEEPILTFDQAYNLTYGDTIRVEISTDGGNTYVDAPLMEIVGPPNSGDAPVTSGFYDSFGDGTPATRPNNKIELDLSNYAGMGNLRIRWLYDGTSGGIYTIDEIGIPQDPQNVQLIWYYDDDLNDPDNDLIQIGEINESTVTYTPTKIGWNDFEVQTALVFDTNGDPCESAENSAIASVYVFDNYESVASSSIGECGALDVQLSATITGTQQGVITEFPFGEGSTVKWEVITAPATYTFSEAHFVNEDENTPAIEDPNAIFQPPVEGDYTLRYTITPNESQTTRDIMGETVTEDIPANPCPATHVDTEFTFTICSFLDFDGVDDHIVIQDGYSGARTIEAWIRPEELNGADPNKDAVILSNESFELYIRNGQKLTFRWGNQKISSNRTFIPDTRWYHVAVVFDAGSASLYIDGIEITDRDTGNQNATGTGAETIIGARFNGLGIAPDNYFSGWIEELRIWNTPVSLEQIRFLMNQHIDYTQAPNLRGEIIPLEVPGGLNYANLLGYYRLIAQLDAIDNTDPVFAIKNGYTPDMATNASDGRLYNISTWQENTAPLPYYSRTDSQESSNRNWMTDDTWRHWQVWDPPNSRGIDNKNTLINWNIAVISHNIDSGNIDANRDLDPWGDEYALTLLGLISESGLLRMADPATALDENNPGEHLRITHYLRLDGNIDLVGESQLIQDQGSILYNGSAGWLERDQQGTRSSYNYNYWSSPVSLQGSSIPVNADYSISQVLLDGTVASNPKTPSFQGAYHAADHGDRKNPIILSTYWMWRFRGTADVYGDWRHVAQSGMMKTGEGYTMKGTSGTAGVKDLQNYVFKGKPHNGDFTRNIANNMNYLLGNPYPSSMDADEFLLDNLKDVQGGRNSSNIFNGVLYYWDHFAGQTHYLADYIGGYAAYSLAGGVPGVALDPRVNNNNQAGTKIPSRFIPVAQGFFLLTNRDDGVDESTTPQFGDVVFKNSQRIGIREGLVYKDQNNEEQDPSVFLRPIYPTKKQALKDKDSRTKLRLKFSSPKGYNRQILVTKDQRTTTGYDIGYDAPLADNHKEDMYWLINDKAYVIQGVPDFDTDRILPLGIRINLAGEFKIKIDSTENWEAGKPIYLKDKLLDTVHDIVKEAYIAKSEPGEIKDRFEIVFKKESTEDPDPAEPDPSEPDPSEPDPTNPDPTNPDTDPYDPVLEEPEEELPIIDGLLDIGYSHFTKTLKIYNYDQLEIEKVMVFDMGGKLIQEFTKLPKDKEINLYMRPVRSGIYIVKAFCKKGICNKKIVIK